MSTIEAPNGYLNPNNPDHKLDPSQANYLAERVIDTFAVVRGDYNRNVSFGANGLPDVDTRLVSGMPNREKMQLLLDFVMEDGYGRAPWHLLSDAETVHEQVINLTRPKPFIGRFTPVIFGLRGPIHDLAVQNFKAQIVLEKTGMTQFLLRNWGRKLGPGITYIDGVEDTFLGKTESGETQGLAYYFSIPPFDGFDNDLAVPMPEIFAGSHS